MWCLLLLVATVRSFARMPFGISDRCKTVLWPGCEGRARCSLHTKNVRLVWLVVKRRGCCCNLSVGVALIGWFTTNRTCAKNNTHIYVARTSNKRVIMACDLYFCLQPQWSFVHLPLGLSDRNTSKGHSAVSCLRIALLFIRASVWLFNCEVIKLESLIAGNISRGHWVLRCLQYDVRWLLCCNKSTALWLIIIFLSHQDVNFNLCEYKTL